MSDLNKTTCAEEVRHGLFRYRWFIDDQMQKDGVYEKTFQLCGSEAGRAFTIDYRLSKNDKNYRKVVTVKETLCNDNCSISEFNGSNPAIENQQEVLQSEQSLNESPVCHKKQKLDTLSSPLYVWIYRMCPKRLSETYDNETLFHLSKVFGDWTISWHGTTSCLNAITVWIDFGVSSVKQGNVINTMDEITGMFYDQICCDVQFLFKNEVSIGAHTVILSAGSPVFSAMFQSNFKESQTRQVTIDDIEPEVFRQLLIYLYSGEAPKLQTQVNLMATQLLFEVADKYAVETLKNECVNVLGNMVNLKNVTMLLVWSDFHSIPWLYDTAMKFLMDNYRVICFQPEWSDLMKNHPDLCLEATQRMSAFLPTPMASTI